MFRLWIHSPILCWGFEYTPLFQQSTLLWSDPVGAQMRAKALRRRAPRALLQKITYKYNASYASSPPCNAVSSMGWKLFVDIKKCVRCHLRKDPMFAKELNRKRALFQKQTTICWVFVEVIECIKCLSQESPTVAKILNTKRDSLQKRRDNLFASFLTWSMHQLSFAKRPNFGKSAKLVHKGKKRAFWQKSRDRLLRLWWRDWTC